MRCRIVLTDGTRTDDLYWLTHSGKDIYHGDTRTMGRHHAEHASGARHLKWPGGFLMLEQAEPLNRLATVRRMTEILVSSDLSRRRLHPYNGKKADAVVLFDVRSVPAKTLLRVLVGLMEPGRLDALQWVMGEPVETGVFGTIKQVMVVSSVSPWVFVAIRWKV